MLSTFSELTELLFFRDQELTFNSINYEPNPISWAMSDDGKDCLNGLELTFLIVLVLTLVCSLLAIFLAKDTVSEIKVTFVPKFQRITLRLRIRL